MSARLDPSLRAGAAAIFRPWSSPPERVRIIHAEYLATGDAGQRERWLHVQFSDGRRLLVHPSQVTPERCPDCGDWS